MFLASAFQFVLFFVHDKGPIFVAKEVTPVCLRQIEIDKPALTHSFDARNFDHGYQLKIIRKLH